MRRIRDHQLDSPRLNQVEWGLQSLQTEVAEARSDKFATLGERLDYIMKNAGGGGGGGGLVAYEEIQPPAGSTTLTLSQPYQLGRERLLLHYNGVLLTPGEENDYTEVDGRIIALNFETRPQDRFTVIVMAAPQSEILWFCQQVLAETGQTEFRLDRTYKMGTHAVQVYKNGILQTEGEDNDYVEVDEQTIRMTVPAISRDVYLFVMPYSRSIVNWWRRQVIVGPETDLTLEVGRVFAVGSGQLQVYRNGVLQRLGEDGDYLEIDSQHIQFFIPFEEDEAIQFVLPESGPGEQIGVIQDQFRELEEHVAEVKAAGAANASDLSELQTRVLQLESDSTATFQDHQTQITQAAERIATLEQSISGVSSDVEDTLEDHQSQLTAIGERVSTVEQTISDLSSTVDALPSQVQESLSALSSQFQGSLDTASAQLQASLNTLSTQVQESLEDYESQLTSVEERVSQLEESTGGGTSSEIEGLQQRITSLETVTGEHTQDIQSLTTKVDQVETLASTVVNLGSLLETVESAVSGQTTEIEELGSRVTSLETTTAGQAAAIEALAGESGRVTTLEAIVSTLLDEGVGGGASEERVAALETTVDNQATKITALETTIGSQTVKVTALETQVNDQATKIAEVEQQAASLKSTVDQHATMISNLTSKIDQVTTLESTVAGLSTTLTVLQTTVAGLTTEINKACTPQFESLADRLTYIMSSVAGAGEGLVSYEEILTVAGTSTLTLTKPYTLGQRVILHWNGILLSPGPDGDYEETDGSTLALHFTTDENDRFIVMVLGGGGEKSEDDVQFSGGTSLLAVDEILPSAGSTSLTLPTPYQIAKEQLFLYHNGILLTSGAENDYTEFDGRTVNLTFATEEGDRFVAVIMGYDQSGGSGGGGTDNSGGASSAEVAALERKLAKSDFKLEVLRRAYAHYANEACDTLTDNTGIDMDQSVNVAYDAAGQRVTTTSGGTYVTVGMDVGVTPTEALVLWDGTDVMAEISRDGGTTYEAIERDALTTLTAGAGGLSLRLRFTLAASGVLNHWGLIWR